MADRCKNCGACKECGAVPQVSPYPVYPAPYPYQVWPQYRYPYTVWSGTSSGTSISPQATSGTFTNVNFI